jgi:hypothetical protein
MKKSWVIRALMLSALIASLLFVKWYVRVILLENARNNIYPIDGDSLSIPIFSTYLQLVVIFIFAVLGVFISKKKRWTRLIAGAFMLLAIWISLGGTIEWAIPSHYRLALSFLPTTVTLVCSSIYLFWFEIRQSNVPLTD